MLTLVSYSSPIWADASQTSINADVVFKELGTSAIPFTASSHDPEPHGQKLFAEITGNAATTPIGPYVGPTLAQVKVYQNASLRSACSTSITSGFSSSALGSAHSYPSDVITQGNIDRAASTSGGSIWCADASGSWSFTAHTLPQSQQVQTDMHAHIQSCQSKLNTLVQQVNAATTIADVQAITWT